MADEQIKALEQTGREVMSQQYDPVTWALALASADGKEDEAKATYIRLRAPLLADAYEKLGSSEIPEHMVYEAMAQHAIQQEDARRKQAVRDEGEQNKYRQAGQRFGSFLRALGL